MKDAFDAFDDPLHPNRGTSDPTSRQLPEFAITEQFSTLVILIRSTLLCTPKKASPKTKTKTSETYVPVVQGMKEMKKGPFPTGIPHRILLYVDVRGGAWSNQSISLICAKS